MTKLNLPFSDQSVPRGGVVRQHKGLLLILLKLIDLLLISIAFIAAYYVKKYSWNFGSEGLSMAPNYNYVFFLFLVCFYFSLNLFSVYDSYRSQKLYHILSGILKSCLAGISSGVLLMYFLNEKDVSRWLIVLFFFFSFVILATSKVVLFKVLGYYRKKDFNYRNVLIIGSKARGLEMIKAILQNSGSGYKVVGCLELSHKDDLIGSTVYRGVKIIGTMDNYQDILLSTAIDEIIFAVRLNLIDKIHEYIRFSEQLGINTRIMPDFQIQRIMYRPETAGLYMDLFVGMPTIALSSIPVREKELFFKATMDYAVTISGLILLSPLLIVLALTIKLTSKGPVIFKQERCGLNGRRFMLYKFRTMIENAEELRNGLQKQNEMDGPVFKVKDDPRITVIGKFLRKTSLDELPQLINILKGEMSIVGPRPPLPSEVEKYKVWQRRRLSMKPGLTCIWQTSGRNTVDFERWMRLDLQYIDNWSIWLDLKLLFLTCREVLQGGGN